MEVLGWLGEEGVLIVCRSRFPIVWYYFFFLSFFFFLVDIC